MFARLAPLYRPTAAIVTRFGGNGVAVVPLAIRRLHASAGRCRGSVGRCYRQRVRAGVHGVVAFKLSDIGEGIAEVQIKEW